jgi:ATP-dependent RNA helicase UAP56/SUB2
MCSVKPSLVPERPLSSFLQPPVARSDVSVIVLCHTRRLAFQIRNEYLRFAKYMPNVRTVVFYGGTPVQKDQELLKSAQCPGQP